MLHFGEMGSRWGIARTVGQIYAVLFVAERPLCADDIVERLGVSRSNVSMSLKELQSWRLVRLVHVPDDRRDFFATPEDVWQIVRILVEERKKREIDPTLSVLRELIMQSPRSHEDRHAQERMREMHEVIELMTGWYADVEKLETERLVQLLGLGSKVVRVLEMKDRLTVLPARSFAASHRRQPDDTSTRRHSPPESHMTALDPLLLARIQFGANISFHILFPTITIALGWLLLFFKLRFNATQDEAWMDAYRFFVKVFALSFALGVVSGITMSFQFGTNWPGFMERVGNVAGPLLAYEVLTAFFLEASFLGIMLFGFRRVKNWVHTLATVLVAFGTTLSAFWILVLNSWMHTPAGFEMRDGVAHVTDWWAVVFNPSMPYRLAHMLLASGLTCAFLVAGLSAFRWLRGDRGPAVMAALRTGVTVGALLIPAQILVGDLHGLNTLEHQPAKVAAMEGNWETRGHVPLLLFALPDEQSRSNAFEIGIPNGASLILRHDPAGVVPGLNDFKGEHPPVAPVFFAFRTMVGIGMLMLVVSWTAAWMVWRRRELAPWMARVLVAMTFSGWVATLAGWYVTEIGRQPWLVTGVLSTAQAASAVPAGMIASTLVLYLALYAALVAAYVTVLFYMAGKPQQPAPEAPAKATLATAMVPAE